LFPFLQEVISGIVSEEKQTLWIRGVYQATQRRATFSHRQVKQDSL